MHTKFTFMHEHTKKVFMYNRRQHNIELKFCSKPTRSAQHTSRDSKIPINIGNMTKRKNWKDWSNWNYVYPEEIKVNSSLWGNFVIKVRKDRWNFEVQ